MQISPQLLNSIKNKAPLAIKDMCNNAGNTYYAYSAGGEVEGKDRFVDEIGTGLIWLFGIPTFKKIIDKTLFKKAGIDPNIDIRILKDKNFYKKALDNAPTKEIYEQIKNAGNNIKLTKNLNILKFGLSLGLTMLSYFGLTKYKQNMTKRNIEKEFLAKQKIKEEAKKYKPPFCRNKLFKDIDLINQKFTPSFGSSAVIKTLENIMLDPIKNMAVLDTCISTERVVHSRNKNERKEYLIKEGSFLFFVYGAGEAIKKAINSFAEKKLNTPINFNDNLLKSDFLEKFLKNKKMQNDVKEFAKMINKEMQTEEIHNFIFNNSNSPIIEAAKKSEIIKTITNDKGYSQIDTRKYIDTKQIKELTNELVKLSEIKEKTGQKAYKILNKIRKVKTSSTILNIAICCFALGYIVPKAMYNYRLKNQKGNKDFHVKTEYEKELSKKFSKTL